MTTPEAQSSLATPEQARTLLEDVGEVAVLAGNGTSFELAGVIVPKEVAAHLPDSDPTSTATVDSVRVSQNIDPVSGKPVLAGTVALVSFTRTEHRDVHLAYVTQADYAINTKDGGNTHSLSRHVMSYETGPHKQVGADLLKLTAELDSGETFEARQTAHDQSLAAEAALGLPGVYASEADQIISFFVQLKPPSAT